MIYLSSKVYVITIASVAIGFFSNCVDKKRKTDLLFEEGHQLAQKHCSSCHLFPEAEWLDKRTWSEYVLPKMSRNLGFRYYGAGQYYEDGKVKEAMPLEDWKKLIAYYVRTAPDSLTTNEKKPSINNGLALFEPVIPKFRTSSPASTFVGFNDQKGEILIGDGSTKQLYNFSGVDKLRDSLNIGEEGISKVDRLNSSLWALTMGVLHPSDEKSGKLLLYHSAQNKKITVLDSLRRPVFMQHEDLDQDGKEDIILCEFGNTLGQLSWFQNQGNYQYQQHILRPMPGATKTEIVDFNRDGKPDILALMAQGDEGLFLYLNIGLGKFQEQEVLRFPPFYGSNYFELVDFNRDGHVDIMTTHGDNGDYPPILKPYHGIRLFLNNGSNTFHEKHFLPMNGVGKAIAKDFDGDGDVDIASISFFPDYKNAPNESFIYWENRGELAFEPFTFKEADRGRWLTMETADIDKDGDLDLILGNTKFTLGNVPSTVMNAWNQNSPSFMVLKNQTR